MVRSQRVKTTDLASGEKDGIGKDLDDEMNVEFMLVPSPFSHVFTSYSYFVAKLHRLISATSPVIPSLTRLHHLSSRPLPTVPTTSRPSTAKSPARPWPGDYDVHLMAGRLSSVLLVSVGCVANWVVAWWLHGAEVAK